MIKSKVILSLAASGITLLAASAACAEPTTLAALEHQTIPGVSPEPILEGAGLRSQEDLAAFLDGIMADQMKPQNIAGATLAVVKDGKLIFAKGYGYADVEKQIKVDAATTLFRPGSISKLYTWTAVMQLVEQGKLDLDADVNTYLTQFQIPATYPQPITLRNLLTHSPGLEDGLLGYYWHRSADELVPLADTLKAHMPGRVNPPVTDFSAPLTASYSNWGAALAGLIVANVSGMEYDDYIEKNILIPLGMADSTFREPLPPAMAARMSLGYTDGSEFTPHGFEFIHSIGPAGNMSTTATDMAKFMIAHLQHGAFGDRRILREETARQMYARQSAASPYVAATGLGFHETWINGRRLIGHNGGTLYFNSDLYLFPEENLGLFVSYNSAPTLGGSTDLIRAFMDRYYPAKLPQLKPPADFAERAPRYTGHYRSYRGAQTTNEKITGLFGGSSFAAADNMLISSGGRRWIEVQEGVFREKDGDQMMTFRQDASGRMHALPAAAYKLRWWETSRFHFFLLGFGAVCFLLAIVSALRNRKADRNAAPAARWARRLAALVGVLQLAFLLILLLTFGSGSSELIYRVPPMFRYGLTLPLIALPLTAAVVYLAVIAWRNRYWTRSGRIAYSVIALASAAFLWSLNYWNLLGYKFG